MHSTIPRNTAVCKSGANDKFSVCTSYPLTFTIPSLCSSSLFFSPSPSSPYSSSSFLHSLNCSSHLFSIFRLLTLVQATTEQEMAIPATHPAGGDAAIAISCGSAGTEEPLLPLLRLRHRSQCACRQYTLQDHHLLLHCCTTGNAFYCEEDRHHIDQLLLRASVIRYIADTL